MTATLNAFAPTGAKITDTFECGTGTHSILCFYKDGKSYVHECGDDYRDHDPETLAIDDKVVYQDEVGQNWLLPALTFKTESGRVVHRGEDQPPVEVPNFDLAMTVAFKADLLAGGKTGLTEKDWINTVNAQHWDNASEILHLEGFIRQLGLMPQFAAYAARAAAEENAEADAL